MPDRNVIESYAKQGPQLAESIRGLSKEQMCAFPVPGTWSIQQIVWHIVDSDLILADRMKRIIAEEKPLIIAFDETAFSNSLYYQELDAATGCKIFDLNRNVMSDILNRLQDETFERIGIHNEVGLVTLGQFVEKAAAHLDHHLKFVRDKRKILGA